MISVPDHKGEYTVGNEELQVEQVAAWRRVVEITDFFD